MIYSTANKCNKAKFRTQSDAAYFINKLIKTSNNDYDIKASYLCHVCNCWHLTKRKESAAELDKFKQLEKRYDDLKKENTSLRDKLNKSQCKINLIAEANQARKKRETEYKNLKNIPYCPSSLVKAVGLIIRL